MNNKRSGYLNNEALKHGGNLKKKKIQIPDNFSNIQGR